MSLSPPSTTPWTGTRLACGCCGSALSLFQYDDPWQMWITLEVVCGHCGIRAKQPVSKEVVTRDAQSGVLEIAATNLLANFYRECVTRAGKALHARTSPRTPKPMETPTPPPPPPTVMPLDDSYPPDAPDPDDLPTPVADAVRKSLTVSSPTLQQQLESISRQALAAEEERRLMNQAVAAKMAEMNRSIPTIKFGF